MTSRLLGLDVGHRRIGVALSDELGLTAQALSVIDNTGDDDVHRTIASFVQQYDVSRVVIGLPKRTDGTLGPEADNVQQFGRRLEESIGIPVVYWDERFSTAEAERLLISTGLDRKS